MARKVIITGKKPSEVTSIIEKNHKIKRIDFGTLSDNKTSLRGYLNNPLLSSTALITIWIFIHFTFIHPQFAYDGQLGKPEKWRQYIGFILSIDWTYAFIGTQVFILVKYLFSRFENKIKISNEL